MCVFSICYPPPPPWWHPVCSYIVIECLQMIMQCWSFWGSLVSRGNGQKAWATWTAIYAISVNVTFLSFSTVFLMNSFFYILMWIITGVFSGGIKPRPFHLTIRGKNRLLLSLEELNSEMSCNIRFLGKSNNSQ